MEFARIAQELQPRSIAARDWVFQVIRTAIIRGVLPGGMPGTLNEEASPVVQAAIDYCVANDRWIGAICAAPSILGHKGVLNGKTATCYTGFEKELTGAEIGSDGVIRDGKIITARGAGVAVDFGLELVGAVCGRETQQQIRGSILCD